LFAQNSANALLSFQEIVSEYPLVDVKDTFQRLDQVFAKDFVLDDLTQIIIKLDNDKIYNLIRFLLSSDASRFKSTIDYLFVDSLDQINQMIDLTIQAVE
jgi:hypothetical protein